MRHFSTRLLAGFTALLLLVPGLALAQTAKISGTVVEAETGDPLPGANVRLEGTTKGAATNQNGEYTIFQVQPGTYTVVVSFVGYQTVRRRNVEIVSGITKRLDFELQQAEFEGQEVVVTAEEPLVRQTATNAVRRVGREEIASLPTRSPETYYSLQAGVTVQNGEVHVRGGRSNETNYLLEGVSSRSLVGTDNVVPIIPEALQETQVLAGGYAADKGNANGGIVQQKLRTGGSEISASAQWEGDQIADGFGNGDTRSYGNNDAVLTIGGPLFKDDIRFFVAGNYRDTDDRTPRYYEPVALNERPGGGLCADVSATDCHPPVDARGDTATKSLTWGEEGPGGLQNPREDWRINGTLAFNFDPLNVRVSYAQVTREQRQNFTPIGEFFNQERVNERDDTRRVVSVQPTYFITENTYVEGTFGFFQYDFEIYDGLLGPPSGENVAPYLLDLFDRQEIAKARGLDPTNTSDLYTRFWSGRFGRPGDAPLGFEFNSFSFDLPGEMTGITYQKREQSNWNVDLSLVSQQGAHTLTLGGEYKKWTVRNYSGGFTFATNLADEAANNPALADSLPLTDARAQSARGAGINNYGYDEFGREVDDGPDGPKEPVTGAIYVNDKIEFENIIVNGGLRLNYYDSDSWTPENLKRPPYENSISQILVGDTTSSTGAQGLQEVDADWVLEPRLGMSFPIGDRTVFHLQYGQFSQLPDMANVYEGRGAMARVFSGGNFINDPFAWDVDPIRTTQYEIGFGHQFAEFAAFDLTAYYRRTDDQIRITRVETAPGAQAAAYNLYENGDFSITRGVELNVQTRRFGGVKGIFNYALADAKGTNTNPTSQLSAIENEVPTPSMVQPLGFQQRHTGSVVLDYRSGSDQPRWARDWGVNMLFRFSSGHPFTRSTGGIGQRSVDQGPLLVDSDPRNRSPLEPINSSSTPWTNQLDLRLSKGFDLGPASAQAYIYVQNLLNRANVLNVYNRTGSAEQDGFLSNPSLSEDFVANQGPEFVEYYQQINLDNRSHYRESWGQELLGEPRQVRIGISVTY